MVKLQINGKNDEEGVQDPKGVIIYRRIHGFF